MSLLTDRGIDFEPNQFAFRVIVEATTPARPLRAEHAKSLHRDRRIFEGTPGASGTMVERGSAMSQRVAVLFGRPEGGASGEQIAQIFGPPFVDPEKISDHWLLVIARGQPRGAAVLAVPGMHVLVGQQRRGEEVFIEIEQRTFSGAVITGLMMFE